MRTGRKKRFNFSSIYSFKCGNRSSKDDDHSRIGGPGFSRLVYCNEPDGLDASLRYYATNYVRTTKYTAATFLPKSLFEQFRRVANFYFLVTGILSFTSLAPYSAVSAIVPLIVVIGATMAKEGIEDWRRKQQDIEVNNRKVKIHESDGIFKQTEWKNLKVGHIVKVEKDEFFPADLLLLSSSYDEAVCYVETTNLDGETNLKLKQALEITSSLTESDIKNFWAVVKCEDPNANLYTFVGSMELEGQQHPLSPQQLLLRDSKLRNTDHIYGAVIFTGHDTKVIQNSTKPPSKRSKIEKKTDKIVSLLFAVLFLIAFVGSVFFGILTKRDLEGRQRRWYLRPDNAKIFYDPKRAPIAAIYHFLTALLLYSYLIPISLYVSIEIVKVLQSIFINQDVHMYYEETDKPARARTSNLNEELGQVDTILSDKTGTLTCNSMEFIKCSVAGTRYGHGVTEVEKAVAKREGTLLNGKDEIDSPKTNRPFIKGFNFDDERIMNGHWVNEPYSDVVQKFFRLLAICHTAIPDIDEKTGKVIYEAESPDEAAFVIAAREIGFEFFKRTQKKVFVKELDPVSWKTVERSFELLNVLEFNSSRKRMSVIVRDEEGRLLLLCKGADSVMFERLATNGREYEEETREHVNEYADAGLRTLILAYRELCEEEYKAFVEKFSEAKNSVPECIDKLAQAGIKLWVLTGDKMETAINIGYACSLLRQGMRQITITVDTPEIVALEKMDEKDAIAKVTRLVKEGTKRTTLAIGDGANDVGMLQEADIGIGISGVEGMQAVMSSDIAIAQFRFLERLLLVHGHWCYRRISSMICYFFYKNVTFGFTLFLYEAHASFSGQPAYNDWFLSLYNVFFTSLPVISMGVFDQDVSARFCLKFPLLYQEGVQNVLFSWRRIIGWMLNGVISALIIFFFCTKALNPNAFNKSGKIAEYQILGATMYTCVVWVVNCQMALAISYFTLIQHVFIWGGIVIWYLFLLIYGAMPRRISTTAYKVFVESLAPTPSFYVVTFFVVISALVPYFVYKSVQMRFYPMYHGMIQWIRYEGRSDDPEYCNMVRQRSIRTTTVGFTARSLARTSPLQDCNNNNKQNRR
ncbi:putative phospholipid-transporting ATPase 8 [Phtheirospermum japonicum]|uniref:Phospholipid-transporting ATPase n=1 Tax=Phtheirospermum japonicum TaxID=374723 RepID=A0A830CYX5_9LAMI|nr:putative phospholipid-transporting ATPase 8 [Phtheirospermum japonicum]